MAKRIRRAPGVSESKDFRAREAFDQAIEDQLKLVGSRTYDVPSIASGARATFTITVTGCRADEGQTVQLGLPSAMNTNLVPWAYVSADDTVTVVFYNPTGGAIDVSSATYTIRVMP